MIDLEVRNELYLDFVALVTEAGAQKYLGAKSGEWSDREILSDLEKYWNKNVSEQDDVIETPSGALRSWCSYQVIKEIARKGSGKDDKRLRSYFDIPKKKKKGFFSKLKKSVSNFASGAVKAVTHPIEFVKDNKELVAAAGLAIATGGSSLALSSGVVGSGLSILKNSKEVESLSNLKSDFEDTKSALLSAVPDQALGENLQAQNSSAIPVDSMRIAGQAPPAIKAGAPPPPPGSSGPGVTAKRIGDTAAITVGVGGCAGSAGLTMIIPAMWFLYRAWQS